MTVVHGGSLGSGAPLMGNHECKRSEEFDGQRVSTFGHAQDILEEGRFFTRREVLLLGCFVSLWRPVAHMAPQGGFAGR